MQTSGKQLPAYFNQQGILNQSNLSANSESMIAKGMKKKDSPESIDNVKVIVRVRPPLEREVIDGCFVSTVQVSPDQKMICLYEYINIELVALEKLPDFVSNPNNYTPHTFTFDRVYDQDSTQEEVYENTAKPAVNSMLQGFNATLMAYGQTGTGKTYTMEGFKYNSHDIQRGIIPRAIEDIFAFIQNYEGKNATFMVRASYLQIYNENISDLLRTDRVTLQIREDKKRGVFVEGLSEWAVRSPQEIFTLMSKGAHSRATACTKMNDVSSRSHAIFIIIVEQMIPDERGTNHIKVGKLNLVDLAGSERVRVTGATGIRLEECKKINQSLSSLGNVISSLCESKRSGHIPYRDSKLTRILEDSLGGNCKTTMMAMISPSLDAFLESLSSIKFASRAKAIKNAPIINEDVDQRALLRKYEGELKRLRQELDVKSKGVVDKGRMLQLEEDKNRAEKDYEAAMEALEQKSKEFFAEREEKKRLEEKIRAMNSQLLVGGRKIEETQAFRNAIEMENKKIREEYEDRLRDLEKEREIISEDIAQVDKYKQLLLKQRDIMIALTGRLNERDETIVQLQEELDAFDRLHQETEDKLEESQDKINFFIKYLKQHGIKVPNELESAKHEKKQNQKKAASIHDAFDVNNQQEEIIELAQLVEEQQSEIQRLYQEIATINEHKPNSNHKADEYSNITQEDENILEKSIHMKNLIDSVIQTLSKPNDPNELQKVAKDLISLQKIVAHTIEEKESRIENSNALNNISNFSKNSISSISQAKESISNYSNDSIKDKNEITKNIRNAISKAEQFRKKMVMK